MLNEPLLALLAETARASIPYRIGQAVPIILTIAGIIKCFAISRRPMTNTKSAPGLMLVLIGFLAARQSTKTDSAPARSSTA